jgi:serine/threonine protein phosphatase PrpC
MNPKRKKEEKPKKNSEKKIKNEKENEEKKNISNENDVKTKNIQKIGIVTKAGEEDSGEEKINQDNYFDYDLCNGYKFIGVCDGHGEDGQNVSEYLRNTLPQELDKELNKIISSEKKRLSILESMLQKNRKELSDTETKKEKKDKINLIENLETYEKINELLKRIFLATNVKLIEENYMLNLENSGSTCVSIFLQKEKINKIYIANVGDSRSIIIKEPSKDKKNNNESSWSYVQLSRDHTPSEKDEADRILKHGGEIQQLQNEAGEWEGPFRIYMKDEEGPGLAMSRSFGDVIGSILGVIAEPEVKEYKVEKEDKAIIIASDGLWEYVTNEEVTDIVKNLIYKKDPNIIVNELYKFSYERWKIKDTGIDDTTIICVLLN